MSDKDLLYSAVKKLAHQEPSLRKHLVPLLRKHACTCDQAVQAADGDELMGGRTWGAPGNKKRPDDSVPYNKHEDSPPAGADGSSQRKKYNDWYRKNVCPGHKTNCGL